MKIEPDKVVGLFILVCFAFGIASGCVGLGIGLVFLSGTQGVGLGILAFGGGGLLGGMFGGRRILRTLTETLKEMEEVGDLSE